MSRERILPPPPALLGLKEKLSEYFPNIFLQKMSIFFFFFFFFRNFRVFRVIFATKKEERKKKKKKKKKTPSRPTLLGSLKG